MSLPKVTALQRWLVVIGFGLTGIVGFTKWYFGEDLNPELSAIVKLGSAPNWTEEMLVEYAKRDFIATTPGTWTTEAVEQLITRNPGIQLGSYFSVFVVQPWMEHAPVGTYGHTWWKALEPYLLPGPVAIYGQNWVWDVTNPDARTAAIAIAKEYVDEYHLTWLMLDFMADPLPDLGGQGIERLDFDRNKIVYWDDPAERQMIHRTWQTYLEELHEAMPYVQMIPNGNLLMGPDPCGECAALADGCYIEAFPNWFFGSGTLEQKLVQALSPRYSGSLHTLTSERYRNGRGWTFIEETISVGVDSIAPLFPKAVHTWRDKR